jgi:hypothetical protein
MARLKLFAHPQVKCGRGDYLMATIRIKPIDQITKKWSSRAGAAGADYTSGIQNPRRPQAQAAADAAGAWAAGVNQAAANNTFGKNVLAAQEKYLRNAASKGAARYPQGVAAATSDFSSGLQPYLDVLANVQLPPRLPKGDPGNIQRVAAVGAALRAKKLSK